MWYFTFDSNFENDSCQYLFNYLKKNWLNSFSDRQNESQVLDLIRMYRIGIQIHVYGSAL